MYQVELDLVRVPSSELVPVTEFPPDPKSGIMGAAERDRVSHAH